MSAKVANIAVDPALSRKVKALMDLAAPTTAKAIEKYLTPVFDTAKEKWPVRKVGSLDSKGKLALEYTVKGGIFKATLTNRAGYAWYINGNKTAQSLILSPGREATKKIAAEIGPMLAAQAGKVK